MPTFPPGSRTDVWTPDRFGMPFDAVAITASDGTKTVAYYIPPAQPQTTRVAIVFCHANAGNLGHRLPIVKRMREMADCAVFMPSYRGYGKSEGKPDEAGIKSDVQAGLEWFVEKLSTHQEKFKYIAYGQSIGGAVAIDLVSQNPKVFSGLIVENTFLSIPDLIPHVMPFLKYLTFLCRQRWMNKERIALIDDKVKILLLSGTKDTLIPPSHSETLYNLAKKRDLDVEIVRLEGGGHNDTVLKAGYFEALKSFIESFY